MSSRVTITGLTSDDATPGVYTQTSFNQAGGAGYAATSKVLLVGNLTSGTRTGNTGPWPVTSIADANAQFGVGSELYTMCVAALSVPGADVYAYPVPEPSGGTAAHWTVTFTGTPGTATGQYTLQLGKRSYTVASGATLDACGENLEAAINADTVAPWTANNVTGTVTITMRNKGVRGNWWYGKLDSALKPAWLTVALTGGTAHGELIPGTGGLLTDDLDASGGFLEDVVAARYDKIAFAQSDDSTSGGNVEDIETLMDSEASALINHLEQAVLGLNGASADASTLASTTLNAYRCQLIWGGYTPNSPIEWISEFAALRAVTESSQPNSAYDGQKLTFAAAQDTADIPAHSTIKAMLNAGVTPLTTVGGEVQVVRSITTKCLTGTVADYGTRDTYQVSVPDRINDELKLLCTNLQVSNPFAGPDPAEGEGSGNPDEGTLTPKVLSGNIVSLEQDWASASYNWITSITAWPPFVEWDSDADRLMTAVPVEVKKHNHQIGVDVRQVAA